MYGIVPASRLFKNSLIVSLNSLGMDGGVCLMCIAKIAEEYCITQKQRRKNVEHLNLFVIKNTLSVILKKIIRFLKLINLLS